MSSYLSARLLFTLGLLAVVTGALPACAPGDDDLVTQSVDQAPPQAEFEEAPVLNDPSHYIWRPGYWVLSGGTTFIWIPGTVIPRPDPTAVWADAHWVHHTFGWSFEQGHWQ